MSDFPRPPKPAKKAKLNGWVLLTLGLLANFGVLYLKRLPALYLKAHTSVPCQAWTEIYWQRQKIGYIHTRTPGTNGGCDLVLWINAVYKNRIPLDSVLVVPDHLNGPGPVFLRTLDPGSPALHRGMSIPARSLRTDRTLHRIQSALERWYQNSLQFEARWLRKRPRTRSEVRRFLAAYAEDATWKALTRVDPNGWTPGERKRAILICQRLVRLQQLAGPGLPLSLQTSLTRLEKLLGCP